MKVREFGSLGQFKERQILSLVLLAFGLLTLWLLPASKSFGSETSEDKACSIVFSALFRQMQGPHSRDWIVGRSRELTQMEALIEANKNILLTGNSGVGKTSLIESLIREHQQNRLENFKPGSLVFAQFDWRDASLTVRDGSPIDGTSNFNTALNNLVNSSSGKKIVLHIPDFDMFLLELQRRPDFNVMALQLKDLMANKKIQVIGELSGRLSKDEFKDSSSPGSALSIDEMIRHDSPFKDFFETLDLASLSGDEMILAMGLEATQVTKETGISFDTNALKAILTLAGNEFNFNASMLKTAKDLLNQIALEKSRSLKSNSNFALSRIQREIEETKSIIRELENVDGQEEALASQKNRLANLEAKRDSARDVARKESSSQAPVTEIRDRIQDLENQIALERDASKTLDLKAELRSKKTELEAALQNNENASKPSRITADVVTQWASDLLGREIKFSPKDFDRLLRARESFSNVLNIIEPEDLPHYLAEVSLPEETRAEFYRIKERLEHPDLAELTGTNINSFFLLYGPAGNGKTMAMMALAKELGATYMELKAANILDKYVGGSEGNIKEAFEFIKAEAATGKRILVAVDEAESLFKQRGSSLGDSGVADKVTNEALAQTSDIRDRRLPNLVMIGATNHPWLIDTAMTRAGRVDNEIYIGLPDQAARKTILENAFEEYKALLPQNLAEILKELSEKMEGWSAAEITHGFSLDVKNHAFYELRLLKEGGHSIENWRLSEEKMRAIFEKSKKRYPATSKTDLERLRRYRDRNAQQRQQLDEAEPGSLSAQE